MQSREVTRPALRAVLKQELLSDVELAALLGITTAVLRKWRVQGKGPKWIKLGSLVRYRLSDAYAFVENCPSGGAA
jgi:predicted DNA-binding transcriptional regulator AlpA